MSLRKPCCLCGKLNGCVCAPEDRLREQRRQSKRKSALDHYIIAARLARENSLAVLQAAVAMKKELGGGQ